MGLFQELKRRNVFRVAAAYAVTAWLLIQVADLVLANIGAPEWVMQAFLLFLALGFVLSLVFSWAFELTPEGIKRESDVDRSTSITHETGRRLDYVTIALLVVVVGFFVWDSRLREPRDTPEIVSAGTPPADGLAPAAATARQNSPSIAVLPFVNLSSDPEQEFFSDGISEELLNVLAQIPDLRVAARTSSFQFKGDNRDISEIAGLLKVNHVLEGSVRKAGNRLRITAQLIEADGGFHLWSETYDRELKDIFAIQDEISAAIGDALVAQLQLEDDAGPGLKVAESANTGAYEAYLHGRYLINQRGNKAITEAVTHLKKSIRLDPEYAPSRAQLGIAYTLLRNDPGSYGDLTLAEVNEKAGPHIEKAFALDPGLAEVWGAKTMLAQCNDDYGNAVKYAERALELNPVYIDAMNWINTSALLIGEYELAERYMQRLIEADPLSVIGRMNYAGSALVYQDPEQARNIGRELVEANAWAGYTVLGNIEYSAGNIARAIEWTLKAYQQDPVDTYSNRGLTGALAEMGFKPEARRVSRATRFFAATTQPEFAEAAAALSAEYARDPANAYLLSSLIYSEYFAGNFDTARSLLEKELAMMPGDQLPVGGGYSMSHGLRLAWLRQQAGETAEATGLLSRVEQDLRKKDGTRLAYSPIQHWDRARLHWLRGKGETALEVLEELPTHWLGPRHELLDPLWGAMRDNPRYLALVTRYDEWLAVQRAEVQDLICHRNPIPDDWQPLAETCEDAGSVAAR